MRASRTLLIATLFGLASVSGKAAAGMVPPTLRVAARGAQNANPEAVALAEFQDRLQKYLQLRQRLADKLKPLSSTASASQLVTEQESLAAALRDVRRGARPGDLIPPAVADQIRRTVVEYFRGKDGSTTRAVFEEVPEGLRPVVNRTYPETAAFATVPAILLNNLPRLPDNLQYRFVGRHIVLVDGDTRLMMDYIVNGLPPH